jgi:hypothetical protein
MLDTDGEGATTGTLEGAPVSFWMALERGERLWLRLTSPDFDTVLRMVGGGPVSWFNDDAGDTGPDGTERALDSTLEVVAPRAGLYEVRVEGFRADATGDWLLRWRRDPPVQLNADGSLPAGVGYAGRHQRGRVLALLMGITAYETSTPLYGCADDAILLGSALTARALITDTDLRVVTDRDATADAFLEGARWLADQATPEDLVLVFFSGHGGTMNDDDPTTDVELNGVDETLVFFDRQLRDDEVVAALGSIQARTVLAIDACQAGGFARDWMQAPERIGLFSSDEDVLSDTAQPVGAGGYLSWALRRAVVGDADRRPLDNLLTAGELTDALVDAFAELHTMMNSDTDLSPVQRLVVERGSVGWSDPLWVYPLDASGQALTGWDVELRSPRPDGTPWEGEPHRIRGGNQPAAGTCTDGRCGNLVGKPR